MEKKKKGVAILGSTGSIGTQALDVISQHRDMYSVELLTANNNSELLIRQAIEFDATAVVICNKEKYSEVREALDPHDIKVYAGVESICDAMQFSTIDTVLAAMVGFSGLQPAIAAIKARKTLALANKETLVAAGAIITDLCEKYSCPIIPVDSEHSAIFQCLQGEYSPIDKILLTASGGPFLHSSMEEIAGATREQALNHPKWKMGAKVTIDSASMMNKGLEMIEAKWLFDLKPEQIEVVIHPQSIIHSMVQFLDGTVLAQMSIPDMRIPIQYGLSYPVRPELNTKRLDFRTLGSIEFIAPDFNKFPAIQIAYDAIGRGGNIPCAMNAANEVAVAAFLQDRIRFRQITDIVEKTIATTEFIAEPTIDDILQTHAETIEKVTKEIHLK